MRGFALAASLVVFLSAAPVFAQAAGQGQARPAQPAAQGQPRPAQPAQPPPAQTAPAPAPQPPAPFPQGAKIAFVNLQAIAQLSNEGKAATAKVQGLIQKKQTEAAAKQKALSDNQNKLAQSGTLLSEAARAQLEKDIEKQNVEGQRFQQDAQAEINELNQSLQNEFEQKLRPILQELAKEKGLQILFSAAEAGVAWADPGLDLTQEAIKKLDGSAGARPAAAPTAAPAPSAAPPKQ